MEVIVNTTGSKKDLVKAANAVNAMNEIKENEIKIDAIIMYFKKEKDEDVTVSAVRTDGEWYTSISPTIASSLEMIAGAFEDELSNGGVEVIIKGKTSKQGREFLYVDIC